MVRFGKWSVARISKLLLLLGMTVALIVGGIFQIPLLALTASSDSDTLSAKSDGNLAFENLGKSRVYPSKTKYIDSIYPKEDIRRRHFVFKEEMSKYFVLESRPKQRRPLSGGYTADNDIYQETDFDIDMLTDMKSTHQEWPWGSGIKALCDNKTYPSDMQTASVIITFHDNELWACVLHTVHSILQRTPPHLLKEIILVDDNSSKRALTTLLDKYVRTVLPSKVHLLHTPGKVGLIRARLLGTRNATGDVIVCMDSHMEVQQRWLEPLLYEIRQNPKTLAASFLDWMSKDSSSPVWNYQHGASKWKTYFDWTFTFGFQEISLNQQRARKDPTQPIETPVYVGTIFAMDRNYFNEIGAFDDQMEGWGGENLDLPLRVWMCGGRVVNVPCSHAAHYEHPGHRLYRMEWDHIINHNYRRVAEVWLDQYKKYFYEYLPEAKLVQVGDISQRQALRKKCPHNFEWFLDNIFPELGMLDRDSFAYGGLTNLATRECFDLQPPTNPRMRPCSAVTRKQGVFWSTMGELRYPVHVFNTHLSQLDPVTKSLKYNLRTDEYMSKYMTGLTSRWMHWKNGLLVDHRTRQCLEHNPSIGLQVTACNATSLTQQWKFDTYTSHYDDLFRQDGEKLINDALSGTNFVPVFDRFAREQLKT